MGWLIAVADRMLTEQVSAEPDAVRNFYVDLGNMTLVHPLVVAVHTLGRSQTSDGYVQVYRVRDRIPLGPLRLRIAYTARLRVPAVGEVMAEAYQFPRVRLLSTVTFERIGDGTRVVERMRIEAPRLLAGLTVRQAVKAHIAMLSAMRRYFEAPVE